MSTLTTALTESIHAMQHARNVANLSILGNVIVTNAVSRFAVTSTEVQKFGDAEVFRLQRTEKCRIWAHEGPNFHVVAMLILADYWSACRTILESVQETGKTCAASREVMGWTAGPNGDDLKYLLAQLVVEERIVRDQPDAPRRAVDTEYVASAMGQRDKWIHDRRTQGDTNQTVIEELARIFVGRGWDHVTSAGGIRDAVKRWILQGGGNPLPAKQKRGGRPENPTVKTAQ